MTPFFDSSVIVAAFHAQDAFHTWAMPIFKRAERPAMALHSMAEVFSILTGKKGWRATDAAAALRVNLRHVRLIALEPDEMHRVFETAQGVGVRGGAVYDALILACARKVRGGVKIFTSNPDHFRLFAPDLHDVIVSPSPA